MGANRAKTDHSGQTYGAVEVGDRITDIPDEAPRLYEVEYTCCGTETILTQKVLNGYRHTPPMTCHACRKHFRTRDEITDERPSKGIQSAWGIIYPLDGWDLHQTVLRPWADDAAEVGMYEFLGS